MAVFQKNVTDASAGMVELNKVILGSKHAPGVVGSGCHRHSGMHPTGWGESRYHPWKRLVAHSTIWSI